MQELLNQVIVLALAAEQDIPDVCISDEELMEELASVRLGGIPEPIAVDESDAAEADDEIPDAEKERIALQRDLELAAAEEVAEPAAVEPTQIEKFKADRRRILENRTIRELKSLASESGISRYNLLTKDQLITALV